MVGSIEYSTEYIKLWNLFYRCKSCRDQCPIINSKEIIKQLRERGWTRKAIRDYMITLIGEHCKLHSIKDLKTFDVLRFEELKENYDPVIVDYDNPQEDAVVDVDENGAWMKIELTSLV